MIDRRIHPRCRRAFTLIESMATVSVLAVLGSIASFLILDAVDGYTDAATSAQLHAELSIAMDRAMREIRKIELDTTASGVAPDITSINAAGDNIQWNDSVNGACSLYKTGANLMLDVSGSGAAVLLGDVTAFSVKAHKEDDSEMVNPVSGGDTEDIRRIALNLTVQRNGVSESLRAKVFIRSTMSGAG
jgi:prepilin-type N-terminal cleavage/methylation domain-containing protein